MYDYHRHERFAQELEKKAHRRNQAIILLCGIVTIGLTIIRHIKKEKEREIHQITLSYLQAKKEIECQKDEIITLKNSQSTQEEIKTLLKEKEKRIIELENQKEIFIEKLGREIPNNDEEGLMGSNIVLHFKEICNIHSYKENGIIHTCQPRTFETQEWEELLAVVKKYHYSFYYYISFEQKLPKLLIKVCVLSRLGFTTNEMATLIGTSVQSVSNARRRAAERLFNSPDTTLLDTRLPKT